MRNTNTYRHENIPTIENTYDIFYDFHASGEVGIPYERFMLTETSHLGTFIVPPRFRRFRYFFSSYSPFVALLFSTFFFVHFCICEQTFGKAFSHLPGQYNADRYVSVERNCLGNYSSSLSLKTDGEPLYICRCVYVKRRLYC